MKRNALFIILFCLSSIALGQQTQTTTYEQQTAIMITSKIQFQPISNRRIIEQDTLYSSNNLIKISPNYIEANLDGADYIIFQFINWTSIQSKNRSERKIKGKKEVIQMDSDYSEIWTEQEPVLIFLENLKDKSVLNSKFFCLLKSEFEAAAKVTLYSTSAGIFKNYNIAFGQLTVPFKLRPESGNNKFQMTTDVTIGSYVGIKKRISSDQPNYLSLVGVAGLTFINVENNSTTISDPTDQISKVSPGFTWATGIILELNKFSLGFVAGRDYASGYADNWVYHNKTWYSFAIGFNFLK